MLVSSIPSVAGRRRNQKEAITGTCIQCCAHGCELARLVSERHEKNLLCTGPAPLPGWL